MDSGSSSYLRFLRGEDGGLEEIIIEYKDGLIFYLNSLVCDLSLAEELAEDTFVLLCTKKPKDKQKGSFKTWLYTIGRNVAISHFRRAAKKETLPIEDYAFMADDGEDVYRAYLKEEQKIKLHKALSTLKLEHRQVIWLLYFENLSYKEIAAILNKSVHATEMLASRARQSLRSELEKEGFVYENQ